jgi:galactokinase
LNFIGEGRNTEDETIGLILPHSGKKHLIKHMASNQMMKEKVKADFLKNFDGPPLIVRSPGRVNIIGEHTDYNNGFVLPAAIDKAIYVAVSARDDRMLHLYSGEFDESFTVSLDQMASTEKGWPNYILGVADQLLKRRSGIKGFNLAIDGDVPIGSGLSSSAAMECATAFALNELFGLGLSRKDMVFIAQEAEHEFAGVRVGVMDMFASLFGKKDHVIKLDCQNLDYEYVPFKLDGYQILLLNTNIKHSLASSEYNTRRSQCEEGVELVRKRHPEVKSLREVTLPMLDTYVKPVDELVYRRCRYIVEENERLLAGCEDLRRGDLAALGKKMFRTHDGLSREYEVSCRELDFLVDHVRDRAGVLGARMMGGGFGGCTINIVRDDVVDDLVKELSQAYREHMNRELTAYVAEIEEGTALL